MPVGVPLHTVFLFCSILGLSGDLADHGCNRWPRAGVAPEEKEAKNLCKDRAPQFCVWGEPAQDRRSRSGQNAGRTSLAIPTAGAGIEATSHVSRSSTAMVVLHMQSMVQAYSRFLQWMWFAVEQGPCETEATVAGRRQRPPSVARIAKETDRPQSLEAAFPQEKGKGKGKQDSGKDGAAVDGSSRSELPQPPALQSLPQPPVAKLQAKAPAQSGSSTVPAATEEKKLIMELMATLQPDQLPPELQKRLSTFARDETHQQGKNMHRLVSEQTQLRKQLEALRADRATFASAWEQYVIQLLDLWQQQGEARMKALQDFATQEVELATRLATATQALSKASAAAAANTDVGQATYLIEDDDEEDQDAMVTTAVEVEAEITERNRKAQQSMQEQQQKMQELLQQAKQEASAHAEEVAAQREGSRTPRRRGRQTESGPQPEKEKPSGGAPPGKAHTVAS